MNSAPDDRNLQGNAGDGPELWAREVAEWRPIEVVEDGESNGEADLEACVVTGSACKDTVEPECWDAGGLVGSCKRLHWGWARWM
jgi:hypothetical protein